MARVYGIAPWGLRRLTIGELAAFRADLQGAPRDEERGG